MSKIKHEYRYNHKLKFIKEDIKGNLCINNQFVFKDKVDKLPFGKLAKWLTAGNIQRAEKKKDKFIPHVIPNTTFISDEKAKIVWLGHSSFYIYLNGIRILTDPIFFHLAPVRMRRSHPIPCSISYFKNIDLILLSHGHRDHLDYQTLRKLVALNPQVEVFCPLGFKRLLKQIGFSKIQEAAWWQRYNFSSLQIDFLPAKHWNRRYLFDYNKELWGSFVIQHQDFKIYFAGDTGYADHFKEIQNFYHLIDVALMPIGAYKPRYIMKEAHTSPQEAVKASNELNAQHFIPMHYGTFDLSDEPASEPLSVLKQQKADNILNAHLNILDVGEEWLL